MVHWVYRLAATSGFEIAAIVAVSPTSLAQSFVVVMPSSNTPVPPNAIEDQIIPKPPQTEPLPVQPPQSTPAPSLQVPTSPPLPETPPASGVKFRIKRVEVLGNTILQAEIAKLTQPFTSQTAKAVTFEELVALRSAITQLYVERGYITSGAFLLNNQSLSQGIVQIQVVEGELEQIEITGLTHLRESYIRSRLEKATHPPLNQRQLERSLQLLQLDPLLERVNAELTAGSAPGRNILKLNLKEAPPFNAGVAIANNQPPSIGEIQGSLFASYANLTGFGDRLSFEYGRTGGLNSYDINYAFPFNGLNGTFNFRYNRNGSEIVETVFRDLGIRSNTETFSFSVRQPVVRTPETEFALGLGLDLRRSQTFILDDIPFSFSEGPDQGRSKVSVIRFFQDWVQREPRRVLAARSQFNFGINAFDATINDSGTDGQFFSWLGQFQWVQQVSSKVLMIARIDAQLTPNSLLSLEQFSLGGVDTVRGYRQNQLVSDNGILAGLEFRIPLTRNPQTLQITPFFELGTGWNVQSPDPDPGWIAGLGLGVRWNISPGFDLRLDYGIPLVSVPDEEDSLQEHGFYFSLRYQPF